MATRTLTNAEALPALVPHSADVRRRAVGPRYRPLRRIDPEAELGGHHQVLAPHLAQEPAEQELVVVGAVDLRGVEEVSPELDVPVQHAQGLRLVGRAVGVGHAHAAQADGGDLEAGRPQAPSRHRRSW